jgi:hypothetical protein
MARAAQHGVSRDTRYAYQTFRQHAKGLFRGADHNANAAQAYWRYLAVRKWAGHPVQSAGEALQPVGMAARRGYGGVLRNSGRAWAAASAFGDTHPRVRNLVEFGTGVALGHMPGASPMPGVIFGRSGLGALAPTAAHLTGYFAVSLYDYFDDRP